MMPSVSRRLTWLALVAPILLLPSACAFDPGYGYGYAGPDIGVGIDYYEPFGFDYGGWGGNYRTGPPRGGYRSSGPGHHAYRSAPPSHGMPSIPAGPHGSGGRGSGGRR
jgi:hypothetical protein